MSLKQHIFLCLPPEGPLNGIKGTLERFFTTAKRSEFEGVSDPEVSSETRRQYFKGFQRQEETTLNQ